MGMYTSSMVNKTSGFVIIIFLSIFLITGCVLSKEGDEPLNDEINKKLTYLYNEWLKHIKKPDVLLSSNAEAYIKCDAYKQMVKIDKAGLPFLVEKIKEGKTSGWKESQFFLWRAIRDISGVDLTDKDNVIVSEQEMAERYIQWWEKQK